MLATRQPTGTYGGEEVKPQPITVPVYDRGQVGRVNWPDSPHHRKPATILDAPYFVNNGMYYRAGVDGTPFGELRLWCDQFEADAPVSAPPVELPAVKLPPEPAPATITTTTAAPPATTRQQAKQMGYEGDPCRVCQSMMVTRNGSCLKCDSCGATTGCS